MLNQELCYIQLKFKKVKSLFLVAESVLYKQNTQKRSRFIHSKKSIAVL